MMPDENITNVFEKLSVSSSKAPGQALAKQRFNSIIGDSQQQRDPLKVTLGNLQTNGASGHRAPSVLIRKASTDKANRIPSSIMRKPSIDRMNSTNTNTGSGSSTIVRKQSMDLQSRQPSLIRKGSLDGLSVNLNPKRVISSSTSNKALNIQPPRGVDIGTYDGSLERDEKRGRRSNDVRGGLLDLDARQ